MSVSCPGDHQRIFTVHFIANCTVSNCYRWHITLDHHLPTVDWDGSVLAELLFCFMYLANEINEALSWFWHSLFRPVCELKLPYCPWLSILREREGTTDRHRGREYSAGKGLVSYVAMAVYSTTVFVMVKPGSTRQVWSIRANVSDGCHFTWMYGVIPLMCYPRLWGCALLKWYCIPSIRNAIPLTRRCNMHYKGGSPHQFSA